MGLSRSLWSIGLGLAIAASQAGAAEPMESSATLVGFSHRPQRCCPADQQQGIVMPTTPQEGDAQGAQPAQPPQPAAIPDGADNFAQAPRGGTGAEGSYNPNMFGDFLTSRFIFIPPDPRDFGSFDGDEALRVLIPEVARGLFKIAENESPRPQDRVFTNYNYFRVPGQNTSAINISLETIGFEKTFLDGNASIGIRVPFFQVSTSEPRGAGIGGGFTALKNALNQSDLGDVTIVTKYAFINDRSTGNVLSGGLVVTTPTGPSETIGIPAADPTSAPSTFKLNPTLLQPYVGGIYNMGSLFVHGFSSVVVPTDSRDVTFLFNDIGIGYTVYKCDSEERLLRAVVPTFEAHVNTPLNHRGTDSVPIGAPDVVDLTLGTTFAFSGGASLGLGVVAPVTGPKPFDVEAQVQFNWRF